jgi:hypothetical protein
MPSHLLLQYSIPMVASAAVRRARPTSRQGARRRCSRRGYRRRRRLGRVRRHGVKLICYRAVRARGAPSAIRTRRRMSGPLRASVGKMRPLLSTRVFAKRLIYMRTESAAYSSDGFDCWPLFPGIVNDTCQERALFFQCVRIRRLTEEMLYRAGFESACVRTRDGSYSFGRTTIKPAKSIAFVETCGGFCREQFLSAPWNCRQCVVTRPRKSRSSF